MAKRPTKYTGPALEQVGPTRWRFEVSVGGRRHKIHIDAGTRREAEELAPVRKAEEIEALTVAKTTGSINLTVHDALDIFLADKYGHDKNTVGYRNHLSRVNQLKPFFHPADRMVDITAQAIVAIVNARRQERIVRIVKGKRVEVPLKEATINRHVVEMLRRVFTHFERRYDYKFPKKPTFAGKRGKEHRRTRIITAEEYRQVMAASRGQHDDAYLTLWRFSLNSGLRRANQLLRWDEVNLAADGRTGSVTVEVKSEGVDKQIETIQLSPTACRIIAEQRGLHPEYVFTYVAQRTGDGRVRGQRYPITVHGLTAWWQPYKRLAGVENLHWHDARHATATTVLDATGNITAAQQVLGHTSVKTTERYAHALPGNVQRALALTDKVVPWGSGDDAPEPPAGPDQLRQAVILGIAIGLATAQRNQL